jgi:hypothetical protein
VVDEQNLSLPEQQSCKGKTTSVVTDMNGNFEMHTQTVKPLLQSLYIGFNSVDFNTSKLKLRLLYLNQILKI